MQLGGEAVVPPQHHTDPKTSHQRGGLGHLPSRHRTGTISGKRDQEWLPGPTPPLPSVPWESEACSDQGLRRTRCASARWWDCALGGRGARARLWARATSAGAGPARRRLERAALDSLFRLKVTRKTCP